MSHRGIYVYKYIHNVLKVSERYSIQIIKIYASRSTASDEDFEELYEDISRATTLEKSKYIGNFGVSLINERGKRLTNYLNQEKV